MNILEVRSLKKRYGGVQAVGDVSFDVRQGEILGLIGPNGAGKTTLFNLISGAVTSDEGRIDFMGRDITKLKSHQVCRLGIARTFQVTRPFGKMTCLENVLVPMTEAEPQRGRRIPKAMELLEMTSLSGKKDSLAKDLNLIDKKRLEMARALAAGPKLILLDEVLGGLNSMEMGEALELISLIRDRLKITVIWIEHIMGAIMSLSARMLVLDQGRLICQGTPAEVSADPTVIKAYLGE